MFVTKCTNENIVANIIIEKEHCGYGEYIIIDEPDFPEEGRTYFVYTTNDVMKDNPDKLKWSDDDELLTNGMGGNSDHNIKRFHGWRGTTNDISIHAHGVRVCTEVIIKEFQKTVHYIVKFGDDLKEGEE